MASLERLVIPQYRVVRFIIGEDRVLHLYQRPSPLLRNGFFHTQLSLGDNMLNTLKVVVDGESVPMLFDTESKRFFRIQELGRFQGGTWTHPHDVEEILIQVANAINKR
jgi:hypothetical protein